MLTFHNETARLQYAISAHELNMAETGYLLAFVQSTSKLYRPIGAGQGSGRWRYAGGPLQPRALAGVDTGRTNERFVAERTIPVGDVYTVVGSAIVDSVITVHGEFRFSDEDGQYVGPSDTAIAYGNEQLDGVRTVDGQITFVSSHQDMELPLMRRTIAAGMQITVPEGYQMFVAGVLRLDGELIVNGEIA